MADLIRGFLQSESGSTAIEYAVVGVLISVTIIAAVTLVGTEVGSIFTDVSSEVAATN